MYAVANAQVEEFQNRGVTLLTGIFKDWVQPLSEAVGLMMDHPSPLERSYQPSDGTAAFFQDFFGCQRFKPMHDFVFLSDAAPVAAMLMRSRTARFFHDHVLVKHAGTSMVTPWHQDQPYYCVQGDQSVSFWAPLDPVPLAISLECISGSHRWSKHGFRPRRFDGSNLYANDDFADMPDVNARLHELEVVRYELQPGDAIAFDFRTIHGAPGNTSAHSRRVVSTRWVGDDARWVVRQGPTSPPFPHLSLPDGAPFDAPDFPVIYQAA